LIKLMPLIQILSNNNLIMNRKDYFLVSKYCFLSMNIIMHFSCMCFILLMLLV
jgi:hypothetical protein